MSLIPGIVERIARARADLRMGLPVVLMTDTEGALALAVETLDEERLRDLRAIGRPVLAITGWRAETLKARAYDNDLARITVPGDVDARWLRSVADPADDLRVPMKGPLLAERTGGAELHRVALQLAKSAHLLPSAVLVPLDHPATFAAENELTLLSAPAAAEELRQSVPLLPVVSARVPMAAAEAGRLHVFRPEDGGEEHYAVEIGRPPRAEPVLARLHSACFTGDVLGSLKCDCGPQLHAALERMGEEGAGVLLYLNQEGRGIGLANKMRAYSLQDQGFDTVEANHRLGFEDDERDFRIGAALLRRLGFSEVRLLTNNPAKVRMMEANGIRVVDRVPLKVGRTAFNEGYLATKARKSGHLL
ncbi:GTP cyclohydrolase [Haematobacter missouriensis]|uniref:GTP cyclohydrolase-2 n=1 Tax=Haematobacter missouriensis TaxID=366616 RepID=A0A212AM84_9RHOB|nr:GTP cyclohydrolase II [Haematobacter missouriensis]KFI32869.1 GTP cyclohydrolase [Haematobacter missouriensis]OWJ73107.1 GTP cyclohydrolase II [Haematobacter missouriensis]OWJ82575.1 GTP cyclohydrolase II [Haematobacter missouriensis]